MWWFTLEHCLALWVQAEFYSTDMQLKAIPHTPTSAKNGPDIACIYVTIICSNFFPSQLRKAWKRELFPGIIQSMVDYCYQHLIYLLPFKKGILHFLYFFSQYALCRNVGVSNVFFAPIWWACIATVMVALGPFWLLQRVICHNTSPDCHQKQWATNSAAKNLHQSQ